MKKLTVLLLTLFSLPGHAADITARISGFDGDQGRARFAMFSTERQARFPDKTNLADYVMDAAITGGVATITINNVPAGEYAVFVYHDRNSNNILDHKWYGPPMEAFGYSKQFKVKLMPPSFDEVSFQITDSDLVLDIALQTF